MPDMAITVEEKDESRRGSSGDRARKALIYKVEGTADDKEAEDAALEEAPDTYGDGLEIKHADVDPIFVDAKEPDEGMWEVTVHYADPKDIQPKTNDSRINFTAGTISRHVDTVQNLVAAESCLVGAEPFPVGQVGSRPLVNVSIEDGKMDVGGVDVEFPTFTKRQTVYVPDPYMTDAFEYELAQQVGTVNDSQWGAYPEGSARLQQVRGGKRGKQDWELTFQWRVRPNQHDVEAGWHPVDEHYTVILDTVEGWQYTWTFYWPQPQPKLLGTDEDGNDMEVLVKIPHTVYVCDLVPKSDFSDLGIEP